MRSEVTLLEQRTELSFVALLYRGVRVRARKRNIVVPLDPGSFANEVIEILQNNAKEDAPLQENLDAGIKVLENSSLDFQRYGDTLFEILFAGGRMAAGANLDNSGKKVDFNVSEMYSSVALGSCIWSHLPKACTIR